jgi:hypothetical protein
MNTTSKHIELLNKVQSMFIEHANANGINLAEKFATVQEFKDFIVALAFKGLCDAGADVATAFDATVGEGQYEALFARVSA